MEQTLQSLIDNILSNEREKFESGLLDLRLIIERYTMDRYTEEDRNSYMLLFQNPSFNEFKLDEKTLDFLKYLLFYAILSFPDRSTLIAKCIKVFLDESLREAICAVIEIYMTKDDDTTCELIFAITNLGDNFFENERIFNLFTRVANVGGKSSREAVNAQFDYYKKNFLS
jgi:hypothetical protein